MARGTYSAKTTFTDDDKVEVVISARVELGRKLLDEGDALIAGGRPGGQHADWPGAGRAVP